MNGNRKVVLAGATSVHGLPLIKEAFNSLDINIEFVEATFMKDYIHCIDNQVRFTDSVDNDSIVIPLTEYWISYCIKTHQCLISEKALTASRSKKYLNDILNANSLSSVKIFSYEQAKERLQKGQRIVVKPEGLNSGLGVQIVTLDDIDKLDLYILQAESLKTKNLRLTQVENNKAILTEYIEGQEYSADCFIFNGRISIVRVCKKKIINVNNKPCTLAYFVVKPSIEILRTLTRCMECLFDKNSISFAQFDFIVTENKHVVIIDFASRIGGGLFELMSQANTNPYADAITGICKLYDNHKVLTQLNYLPVKKGYIFDENYKLEQGYQVIFKHKGDYVTSLPSSIGSRIALVIQKNDNDELSDEIQKKLLIGDNNICDKKL